MNPLPFQFDETIEFAASPTEAELRAIPAARGVIFLSTQDDTPVVLLTAGSMRSRVATRLLADEDNLVSRTRGHLREIVRRASWVRCGSTWETHWRYLELAASIWPKRYASMVSWKPPAWLGLDVEKPFPHFRVTRNPRDAGIHVGPFLSNRDGEAFHKSLIDAFSLCRSVACLRQAPNGPKCNYGQMGRCLSPVDGSISMDDYRAALRDALDFAAGDRAPLQTRLADEMTQAAATLAFEDAAAIKTRLDRLKEFDQPRYDPVAPLEAFRWLFIERGVSANTIRLFHIRPDTIYAGTLFHWPLEAEQLESEVASGHTLPVDMDSIDALSLLRCALAVRHLHADPARRGIVLRWTADIDAQTLYDTLADWMDLASGEPENSPAPEAEELSSEPSS